MTYYAYAPQISTKYTLVGPTGVTAVFNDQNDVNYVGMLSDITGLDSPDIRETADDLVQSDGGSHGDFWLGRRPITITGIMYGHQTVAQRNLRADKIMRASMALRGDATLKWTNSDTAIEMFVPVRRNQPTRITGPWNKEFQIALVSEYATIFSMDLRTLNGNGTAENQGSYPAAPKFRITGPAGGATGTATIAITGAGSGSLKIGHSAAYLNLTAGQWIEIDTATHTAVKNDGTSMNRYIDFVNTTWPVFNTGNNTVTMTASGTLGTLITTWRDTWA